jgi:hypothetical protein
MKIIALSLLAIIVSIKSFTQDSLWKLTIVNEVLSCKFPVGSRPTGSSFVKGFAGELNSDYYALQYYDTTLLPIDNERLFQVSLIGFLSGICGDSIFKGYSVLVVDTSIGRTVGIIGKFVANDSSQPYKQAYYYVTLANNHYYWFYVFSTSSKINAEIKYFFDSIQFDSGSLKEKAFKLTPVRLEKHQL